MTVQPADLWWQRFGACVGQPTNLFYIEKHGSTRAARTICAACDPDIRAECLAYALANNEQFGIWGGTSERERRRLRRGDRPATHQGLSAAPLRAALNALVGPQFRSLTELGRYVAEHSEIGQQGIPSFFYDGRQTVTRPWAHAVCTALGLDPTTLWPGEQVAA
jgi:WhiB family redox-sensing transcriptional regulator